MSAPSALIGYTGFVGSTLNATRSYSALFNSSNIQDIVGQHFGYVVCAGVSAVKWLANREPETDWRGIERLMSCLEHVTVDHFVLISTVDVYHDLIGVDERTDPSNDDLHPYGLHRLRLERFVAERFPSHTIVRLPALFGHGLKKNAIFDLMHDNHVDRIVSNAAFQWYPIRRLANDLDLIDAADLRLINITAEPVTMKEIADAFFPRRHLGPPVERPPRYDLHSIHAALLGGREGYHLSAEQVMTELRSFVTTEAS